MNLTSVQRKLLTKALYTSPVIAVPSISPIILRYEVPFDIFIWAIVVLSLMVFSIWLVNIILISISYGELSEKKVSFIRYTISFAFALGVLLSVREIMFLWIQSGSFPFEEVPQNQSFRQIPFYGIILSFSINSVILTIQDLITVREKKEISDLENSQLKLKNAEIINQELKQQIHPHFLFNALNTLKNLIRKEPNQAEDYLIRLSNFLRISLSAAKTNTVWLDEELNMCVDYLEMQKTRFGETLQYEVSIPKEIIEVGMVPIFSIQLLLENAIKHNAMYKNAPLKIQVLYEEDNRVKVINNRQKREHNEASTAVGLDNLAERYRIISGDQIDIQTTEETFSVSIKILSNESSNHRG